LASLTKNLKLRDCEIDSAKALAGQLATKSYFAGESAGIRLAQSTVGLWLIIEYLSASDMATSP
jgi:hypothetical protein